MDKTAANSPKKNSMALKNFSGYVIRNLAFETLFINPAKDLLAMESLRSKFQNVIPEKLF